MTDWDDTLDECRRNVDEITAALDANDLDRLANRHWSEPSMDGPPPPELAERLARLYDLSVALERRVAGELKSVREELAKGAVVRKAAHTYIAHERGTRPG